MMYWLLINPYAPGFGVYPDIRYNGDHRYPASSDLLALWEGWKWTPAKEDHQLCGVLADYLTDNRDSLLSGATGPSDPAVRLDQLIEYLRSRFRSQFEPAE